jgi:hypothetical protein
MLGLAVLVVAAVGLWANWPCAELPIGTVADRVEGRVVGAAGRGLNSD